VASPSTAGPLASKAPTCDFRVVNLLPQGGDFEEIATLTQREGKALALNPTEFKAAVQADVCRLGGDLVVTEVSGWGGYVRGTVLRKKGP
jgi:hypothetical protein